MKQLRLICFATVEYHTWLDIENELDSQAITKNKVIFPFLPEPDILPLLLGGGRRKKKEVRPIAYI